jgi:hypothetical protein
MTGEEIVGISTEQLEAMSDLELEAFFAPCLDLTRPKLEGVTTAGGITPQSSPYKTTKPKKLSMVDQIMLAIKEQQAKGKPK